MIGSNINSQPFFGCFELNLAGIVMYSKVHSEGIFGLRSPSIVGQNFFDNLTASDGIEEFRKRFNLFVNDNKTKDEFRFDYKFEDGSVKAKVLMINIKKRKYDEHNRLIIVDVRKV